MVLELAEREYMIRGLGYLEGLDDIGSVVVSTSEQGVPVRVADVATVRLAPGVVAVMMVTVPPARRIGSEFMPRLDEGALLYMPTTLPGISVAKASATLRTQDSILASFPEVETVFGKAGRAGTATDPAPLDMFETTITLKPEREWRPGMTSESLVAAMDSAVRTAGVTNSWTMPIRGRIDILATGIRTPVGVKIFGPDLATLERLALEIEAAVQMVPGTRSAFGERVVSGSYVDIEIDRAAAARYGLNVDEIQMVISSAIGGMAVTTAVEGRERYGIRTVAGPMAIKTEQAFPTAWVFVDTDASDLGGYVEEAKDMVDAMVTLPPGYTMAWSGQYEYMQRAKERLVVVVPATLLIVFVLLYMNFGRLGETLIVLLSLPFALVGGVPFMALMGFNWSVATAVGFIALAGVAAETCVVMLLYLDHAWHARLAAGKRTLEDLREAVVEGAALRLRPKMMTVITVITGLLPLYWGSGAGASIMRRIAAPMVGGMVSAMILTLLVVPALYSLWHDMLLRAEARAAQLP